MVKLGDLWLRRELKRLLGPTCADVSLTQLVRYIEEHLGEFSDWASRSKFLRDERGFLQMMSTMGGMYNYGPIDFIIVGGGGAGGRHSSFSSEAKGGAGGGGIYVGTFNVQQPRLAYAVTIGLRGEVGFGGQFRGGAGGDTWLGPYGVAGGGGGGGAGADASEKAGGGAPSATGGGGGSGDGYGGAGTHGFNGRTSVGHGGGGAGSAQHGGGPGQPAGTQTYGGDGYVSGIYLGANAFGPGGGGGDNGGGDGGPGGNGGQGGKGGGTTFDDGGAGGGIVFGNPATSGSVYGSGGGGGGSSATGGGGPPGPAPGIQGVCIVRYLGPQRGLGGSISSSSGYTWHTFTGADTFYT